MKLIDPNKTSIAATTNWVQIKKYTSPKDDYGEVCRGQFNAWLLHKVTTKVIIPSAQVCQKINFVHDCFDGHSQNRDGNRSVREERETFIFEHNFSNNRYLLNPFYLGNNAPDFAIGYDLDEPISYEYNFCSFNISLNLSVTVSLKVDNFKEIAFNIA